MFCKNCGAEIAEDILLCPYCGAENEEVAEKTRKAGNTVGIIRPPYLPDDCRGKWCASDVRDAYGRGLMFGYSDGTFKPNSVLTRGELAAVLRRLHK